MSTKTEDKKLIEWARCHRKIRLKRYGDFNSLKIFLTIVVAMFAMLGVAILLQSSFQNTYAFVPLNTMRSVLVESGSGSFSTINALNLSSSITLMPMAYDNTTSFSYPNNTGNVQKAYALGSLGSAEVATAPAAGYIIVRQGSFLAYLLSTILLAAAIAGIFWFILSVIQDYLFEDVKKCVVKGKKDSKNNENRIVS
jgi:hypothetical protein